MSLPPKFQTSLSLPVVAAPMFLASGPDLVLACCRAGIVGTFPAKNQRTLEGFEDWLITIRDGLAAIEDETGQSAPPFGVNLIVHRTNKIVEEELALCVKYKVPLVITSLGAVPELVDQVHGYGGVVFHDVINLRHAKKAASAGVDGLIAVAAGAGGHTGQASPFGLINEIRQFFDGTVLLSGSISTGADVAAAQMMGADLAYLGTRFINTQECQSPDDYKQMIIDSQFDDIVATPAVSGVNANFLTASLDNAGVDLDAPNEHGLVDIDKELAEALTSSSNDFKAWRDIWSAGHGVGSISDIPPVAELVNRLHCEYVAACTAQQDRLEELRPMGGTA
jgi:nitronate monooxygenase